VLDESPHPPSNLTDKGCWSIQDVYATEL
jgi:hypothetical protein